MKYHNIKKGIFKKRENRFIAYVEIDGQVEMCHVKNTGRCKELLVYNAVVFVQESFDLKRKTRFSLISVIKNGRLINMDSQAPNKAAAEWIDGGLFDDILFLKSERKFNNSRFDFYVERKCEKVFIEIKGVTLEENGIVKFPDAPTQRGVKHINELCEAAVAGFGAYIIFIVQMENVKWFEPNYNTHWEFGEALKQARKKGVKILAFECEVGEDFMCIGREVDVRL